MRKEKAGRPMKEKDPIIAERIKSARKEKKIKQHELAKSVNVSVETIKKWEGGYNQPSDSNMWKALSITLNVPLSYLMNEDALYNRVQKKQIFADVVDVPHYIPDFEIRTDEQQIRILKVKKAVQKLMMFITPPSHFPGSSLDYIGDEYIGFYNWAISSHTALDSDESLFDDYIIRIVEQGIVLADFTLSEDDYYKKALEYAQANFKALQEYRLNNNHVRKLKIAAINSELSRLRNWDKNKGDK